MTNTSEILNNIKPIVKAFVFDFDGTIKSSAEPECVPMDLIKKIVSKNKFVGIVTASGVSAISGLGEQIMKLINDNNFEIPIYLGVANGMALYKLEKNGKQELYNYSISLEDTKKIIEVWKSVMITIGVKDDDLMEKGLKTFNEFLLKNWGEYIPFEFLSLSKEYSGKCFVEKLKSTFVMPKNDIFSQEKFITLMQEGLGEKFIIDMGDNVFAHVTIRPGMAPKLFALNKIKDELKLTDEQIITFGDMPFGNDKGLLIDSKLPYTFTNINYENSSINAPPFLLQDAELAPVASVYRSVEFLINN